MNFSDILALAKQGYKPSDIKELLSIPTEDNNTPSASALPDDGTDGVSTPTPSAPDPNKEGP